MTDWDLPPRWRGELHARRGGVPVPVSGNPVASSRELLRRHESGALYRCEHRAATPGLGPAAREFVEGAGGPLGAAALVAGLDCGPPADVDLAAVVDGWIRERGLVFAALAGAELGGLTVDSEARHGGQRDHFVRAAGPSREPLWRDHIPGGVALRRIRCHLAASSDADYARACAALAEYRDRPVRQRAVVSYLAPTRVDWVDEDCADGGTGPLVYAAHTVDQLDVLRHRADCWRPVTAGDLVSVLEGVGSGGVASVVGWAEAAMRRDRSADVPGEVSREQVVEVLATVPGDVALVLLLGRYRYPGADTAIERAVARIRAEARAGGPAVAWSGLTGLAGRWQHAQPAQHAGFDDFLRAVPPLHDADRGTRIEAVRSLGDDTGLLNEKFRPVAALALQDRFAVETDPAARLDLVFAVGAVHLPTSIDDLGFRQVRGTPGPPPADDIAWLRGLITDADVAGIDPRIGLAAAVTARRLDPKTPLRAVDLDALVTALRADPAPWEEVLDTHWPFEDADVCMPSQSADLIDWVRRALVTDRGAQCRLASEFLSDPVPRVRRAALRVAAEGLRRWRSLTAEVVPLLADRLGDLHPDGDFVGRDALILLAALGPPAVGHAAGLMDHYAALLGDDSPVPGLPRVPAAAIGGFALARLGDPRCIPTLQSHLDGTRTGPPVQGRTSDDDDQAAFQSDIYWTPGEYRCYPPGISDVLMLVPQFAAELAPHLGRRLRSSERPQPFLRVVEAWGEAAAATVPDILANASGRDNLLPGHVMMPVASALRAIGPAAAAAVPLLRDRLTAAHPDYPVTRLATAHALWAITGDPTVMLEPLADLMSWFSQRRRPPELDAASDPVGYVCRVAAELGPLAVAHTDWLRTLAFAKGSSPHRTAAARALWAVTGDPGAAVEILSGSTSIHYQALLHLAEVVPDHPRIVPELTAVLASDVRHSSARDWRVFVEDDTARRATERTVSQLAG
jgi:hypothetical protein